jgi:pyridoxamine 5'-phosphate oxidase
MWVAVFTFGRCGQTYLNFKKIGHMKQDISSIRIDYQKQELRRRDVNDDPIVQFQKWFDEALKAQVQEPNAMTLSTVNAAGQPSGRIVLLKDVDASGFSFYTNYLSKKGQDLLDNPKAALTFFWGELERQVRIEGTVQKLDPEVSTAYFKSRPLGSQIGALTSPQSQVIESRDWLENRLHEITLKIGDTSPDRPSHWGGYVLRPSCIEFWQGRPSRLHDRIAYTWIDKSWKIERLAP